MKKKCLYVAPQITTYDIEVSQLLADSETNQSSPSQTESMSEEDYTW